MRPFNTYGPRQSARAVIPTIISQIASGKKEIRLGSLHPTRDFSFVTDTARGFLQEMEAVTNVGNVTNIGSGFEISIRDTVEAISSAMGRKIKIVEDEARLRPEKSEVDRLFASISRAENSFNWKPDYGGHEGFLRGLIKTAEWFLEPKNLSFYKANIYNV